MRAGGPKRLQTTRFALANSTFFRNMAMDTSEYIITVCTNNDKGVAPKVTALLSKFSFGIRDHAQYYDQHSRLFFMRLHVTFDKSARDMTEFQVQFGALAEELGLVWALKDAKTRPRVVVLVSRIGHCLNDLLFRYKSGLLPIEIVAVISNHDDFRNLVESYGIPFYHFALPAKSPSEEKRGQEKRMLALIERYEADFVVLARYMQILSPEMCRALDGKAINIHHSFLPSFKGARPYAQAHQRGVKLIGATAHFVTSDLDEGPIVEQAVERVDHTMCPDSLSAIGRDAECVVLARAVKWLAEHRVLLNGNKTVVFR
jgi:formyltetrahydrofolate deformylase